MPLSAPTRTTRWHSIVVALFLFTTLGFSSFFMSVGMAATPTVRSNAVALPVNEASGMAASHKHPGVLWFLRDSGTATATAPRAALYAMKLDANGKVQPLRGNEQFPFFNVAGVSNVDWEDLAIDDQHNLWIGDIGANSCNRTQYLYKVAEPDPTSSATLSIKEKYSFTFPNPASGCSTFNSEAMVWLDGKLYIFSKTTGTAVYRVDLPATSPGSAKLVKLGNLAGGVNIISGASLSDDRTRLMVQHHAKMFIYTTANPGLKGDALIKDLISRTFTYSATFDCGCDKNESVEGGAFLRGTYAAAFVAESKEIYVAKPSDYGDTATPAPKPTPTPAPSPSPTPAPNPAPAPTSPTGGCTITDKLVNTCRPWLGVAANRDPNVGSSVREQNEGHEARIGRKADIIHTYHPVGSNQLSPDDKYFINRPNTLLFTNWKPADKWAAASGSNASTNASIDQMADSIKAATNGKKIFMTLNHEAENDISSGASGCTHTGFKYKGSSGTPAEYRAMWRNVQNRFKAKGVTNVVWAIDYMNYPPWDCVVDDLYPGNDLVDWVMFNAYGQGSTPDVTKNIGHFTDVLAKHQSPDRDFASKPWGIVEWNIHSSTAEQAYKYYDDMKAIANNNTFPKLRAYMVFDSIGPEGNHNRVAYLAEKYDPVKLQHYKDFANSPVFAKTAPDPDLTAPSTPSNLAAPEQTDSTIRLTWGASTDNTTVAGYRVLRNGQEVARITQLGHTDSGLTANTAYSYTVNAYDAAGNMSPQTAALIARTKKAADALAPSAPTNVFAQVSSPTEVIVSWNASTDNVGIANYFVQRDGITVGQVAGQVLTYTDTSGVAGKTYAYAVRAKDAAGNVSTASAASVVTLPAPNDTQAPTKPSNLVAAVSGSQINLSWNTSSDNTSVAEYIIYRNGTQLAKSTTTSFGDGTVQAGSTYTYTVAARDAAGNTSPQSDAAKASLPAIPTSSHTPGLAATYFTNKDVAGVGLTRNDATINFNWQTSAPIEGAPADNFSSRWTGRITPPTTGTYTFYTQADDGVRLWVDGKLVIDDWTTHAVRETSGSVELRQGVYHNIRLEYFEQTGSASLKLLWSGPGRAKQTVGNSALVTSSYGLSGAYYADQTLSRLINRRLDPTVDFTWNGQPASALPADRFSVAWSGRVLADTTGPHTFHTRTNDGVRLWVNNQLLIDDWHDHGTLENSGRIELTAGYKYDIRMEYYDNAGQGVAQLLWSNPSRAKQIIPSNRLFDR